MDIVSVLHQNEGGIGKSIPDAQEISRDILRVEGNLEVRRGGFPSLHHQGVHGIILPSRQGRIEKC